MFLVAKNFPESITHGFTTRKSGVSQGSYASLNLGYKWGDSKEFVDENYLRLANAGKFVQERLVTVKQVHGNRVVSVLEANDCVEADGIWASADMRSGVVLGICTADCVPLLLTSACGDYLAAVHSGWRGTVGNIAGQTIETLAQAGVAREQLRAAIGPCIEVGAFEVGDEVAEQFPSTCVRAHSQTTKKHVDLVQAVHEQLMHAGMKPNQIERVGECTFSNPDLYFSYRRDGKSTGQHLAFIGWRSS